MKMTLSTTYSSLVSDQYCALFIWKSDGVLLFKDGGRVSAITTALRYANFGTGIVWSIKALFGILLSSIVEVWNKARKTSDESCDLVTFL